MKKVFERCLSLFLALVMVVALAPAVSIETKAADVTVGSLSELEAALGSADRIVVGSKIAITKNLTIPGNVTLVIPSGAELVIPYDDSNTTVYGADALDKNNMYPYANAGELDPTSTLKHPGNASATYLVTVESGAVIEVSGVLAVGGQYSSNGGGLSGQTAGKFSQLDLAEGSLIDVKSGGVLSSVGYITGEGSVNLASGASAYEPFAIGDYQGGTYVVAAFHGAQKNDTSFKNIGTENSTMPFNSYSLFNIQTRIEMDAGSNLMGYCDLYTGAAAIIPAQHNKTVISVIGSSESIFNLANGYAVLTYSAPANGVSAAILGQTQMEIYGDCDFGMLSLSLSLLGSQINVTSQKVYFALPYSFKLVQKSGTLTVPNELKVKMMPGSEIHIEEGATLNIPKYRLVQGELIVYDGMDVGTNNRYYPSSAKLAAAGLAQRARLVVEGTMKLDGAFGGTVETYGNGTVAVGKNAVLSLGSKEGVEAGWGLKVNILFKTYDYTIKTNNRTEHTKEAELVMHANKYEGGNPVAMTAGKTYYAVSNEPVLSETTYSYTFDPSSAKTAKTGNYSGSVALVGSWAETTDVIYDNGESLSSTAPSAAAGEILTYYADYTFTETVDTPASSGVVYYSMEQCQHDGCKFVGIDGEYHGFTCGNCGQEVLEEHDWVDGECTVCGFGRFNVDAEYDRVVMIDAPACSVAIAAAYNDGKMIASDVNDDGTTAFTLKGLEVGMTVKVFLLDANYAPIADYIPEPYTAE